MVSAIVPAKTPLATGAAQSARFDDLLTIAGHGAPIRRNGDDRVTEYVFAGE
jgi:hypothetical protein